MIRLRPSGVDEILIKRVQDWYEPGPGVFITSTSTLFSPAMLFTSSTVGVWYDPSDLTTLYQNAAGTTPVTAVEQPVGLMLDKSKGLVLGPELVTNGDFSNGNTGWTYTVAGTSTALISGGKATLTKGSSYCFITQTGVLTAGKVYSVTLDVVSTTGVGAVVNNTGIPYATFATSGTKTFKFRHSDGATNVLYLEAQSGTVVFDNISVRELPGNHAFNGSGNSANFPVLSARYNLLTKSEQFDDAVWTRTSATLGSLVTAPDGSLTAQTVNFAGSTSEIKQTPSGTFSSTAFLAYVAVKGTAGETLNYGVSSGADQVLTFNGQWQYINYTRTTSTPTLWFGTWSGATTRSFAVWHPDLRVANDALGQPSYQRVNTATDYDTVGFKPYLKFNGTNQWLQTNSIDFSYGDKMFVSAGVRKLSDAVLGMLFEFGPAVNSTVGTFSHIIPDTSSAGSLGLDLHGNGASGIQRISTASSPATFVSATVFDLAGTTFDTERPTKRINGVAGTVLSSAGATDTGGGNFANYPLYIGSRATTSLWFNGRLYGLVVAGKQASAAEITSTETYINQKTGAF